MKFSTAQRNVLTALDGATAPVEFMGTYTRTLKSLKDKGLITYKRGTRSFSLGTFPYHGSNTYFLVSLTREGSDFIYNGGLDH